MTFRIKPSCAVISVVALVSVANAALAGDDAGVHAFLMNAFGQAGGSQESVAPTVQPSIAGASRRRAAIDRSPMVRYRRTHDRTLTVRRDQPKITAAVGPSSPAKVTIFRDTTLRAGDAVMTADGIRIFAGSRSWPYVKSDFVAIDQSRDLKRDTVKILADLNKAPTI